jgi:hypothetical protein
MKDLTRFSIYLKCKRHKKIMKEFKEPSISINFINMSFIGWNQIMTSQFLVLKKQLPK